MSSRLIPLWDARLRGIVYSQNDDDIVAFMRRNREGDVAINVLSRRYFENEGNLAARSWAIIQTAFAAAGFPKE